MDLNLRFYVAVVCFVISVIALLVGYYQMTNGRTYHNYMTVSIFMGAISAAIGVTHHFARQDMAIRDEWLQFVRTHDCKITERGITGKIHESPLIGWTCDDGVKYYKPEWFENRD